MRKALMLVSVAALPAAFLTTPAHAESVRYCIANGRATFSPPLTSFHDSGTMIWDYSAVCYFVNSDGSSGFQNTSGSRRYDWVGSCVSASMAGEGGDTGVLAGGTQMTTTMSTADRTLVREWTFVADGGNPCNMAEATVEQTGPDYYS